MNSANTPASIGGTGHIANEASDDGSLSSPLKAEDVFPVVGPTPMKRGYNISKVE
jgi:hypothetical protein